MEIEGQLKQIAEVIRIGQLATVKELLTCGLVGFLVGWKGYYLLTLKGDRDFTEALQSLQGVPLTGILLAVVSAGIWWTYKYKNRIDPPHVKQRLVHPYEHAYSIGWVAILWGVIGSILFYWIDNPGVLLDTFRDPAHNRIFSGFVIYGGLIVGAIMVIRYYIRNSLDPWSAMDAFAPGLMIGYAIGRLGCHFSGDGDWGIVNTLTKPGWIPQLLWVYDYPNNIIQKGVLVTNGPCFEGYCTHLVPGVFPTPVYETIAATICFLLLWSVRRRMSKPGMLFGLYMVCVGVERFFIEKIRINENVMGDLTQAEILSILYILGGLGLIIFLQRSLKKTK
jgi:prolipoprotein diacylglyceryltransferase